MGFSSSEADFQGIKPQRRACDSTKPARLSTSRRKHAAILGADSVAVIQTNLAAQIGLKPTSFKRY